MQDDPSGSDPGPALDSERFQECMGPLARFASGLLPRYARGMTDTQDVVQDVLANTARRLASIDCEEDGALLAYLRRAVRHRVIDEIRRATRRPRMDVLLDDCPAPGQSPLDAAIRAQNDRRFRVALSRLNTRDRLAVVLRVRHRLSYDDIAPRLGCPTANAARVAVRRAVERLTDVLDAPSRPAGPSRECRPG